MSGDDEHADADTRVDDDKLLVRLREVLGIDEPPRLDAGPTRWPLVARCSVCAQDKPARLTAGLMCLVCGHHLVPEDEFEALVRRLHPL
jgi:hypothetical protein